MPLISNVRLHDLFMRHLQSANLSIAACMAFGCNPATAQQTAPMVRIAPPPHNHTGKGVLRWNSCPTPAYPQTNVSKGLTGTGRIQVQLSAQAKVLASEIIQSSGSPELDEAARSVLPRCVYVPSFQEGKPVPDTLTIEFVWSLTPEPSVSFDSK